MTDSYEEVRYPGRPRPQTHPSHIATLATLAGLNPPPVERWHVLELGCGDASNLLPMALDFPEGYFFGVDRAREPIDA